ncbi:C2H2 type zinc finger containing, partial [Fusarium albosuccineum]
MDGEGQPEVSQPQEFDEVPVDLDLGFSLTDLDDDYFDLLNLSQFDVQPEHSSSDTNDPPFDTSFYADNLCLDPSSLVPHEMELTSADTWGSSISAAPQHLTATDLLTGNLKIGTRFSRESLQILKRWLALHSRHPYPSEEDNALLQRQTGLNKTQISNWFSNARRKRRAQAQKSNFSRTGTTVTEPVNFSRRPNTPTPESNLDPLMRWVDSPPENEPASATAIARAVLSGHDTMPYNFTLSDHGSDRFRGDASSATSARTSSGSSFASSQSHTSEASFGSFRSKNRLRDKRRRKKRPMPKRAENLSLALALKPYQCTFCTETFRTKYDWQRHEKALHLSLEMWICAPDGPRATNPQTNELYCVFCGKANTDDAHVESHNYSACKVKPPDERTFYRKDHLNQHLRLVHDAQFLDWSMKPWKVST